MEVTKDMIIDLANEMITFYHQCRYYGLRQMKVATLLFGIALAGFITNIFIPNTWILTAGWVLYGIAVACLINGYTTSNLNTWFNNSSYRLKALWNDYEDKDRYETESEYKLYRSDMPRHVRELDRHCWFMTKKEDRKVQRRAIQTMCALFNMKEDEWELPKQ